MAVSANKDITENGRLGQLVGSGQPDFRDPFGERNHIRVEPDRDLDFFAQTVHWR